MNRTTCPFFVIVFTLLCLSAAGAERQAPGPGQAVLPPPDQPAGDHAPRYTVKIVNEFPHDRLAFTQGLVIDNGSLYEGTGLRGRSGIRALDLSTGTVIQEHVLPVDFFGEGITVFNNRLIQLTWRSGTGFVYDRDTFRPLDTFSYTGEGWGITHDGKQLIMSDGTEQLTFLNPATYQVTERISVHDRGRPVTMLNELEYIGGAVYANVWRTDTIAVIDPGSGRVTAWIDLEELSRQAGGDRMVRTLNGIAYDKEKDRLFVTGKLWPKLYEIEIVQSLP
ncbi:MAG: glutaminyl-peptide cyclotransferase [Nitrospiraceae bacterium]|nr:MAG: glutaminyl-peptide cyclotransferase [Nitrospiraceae bacterium]